MTLGPFEVGAFTRSSEEQDRPDIQIYFSAYSRAAGRVTTERPPGFTIADAHRADVEHRVRARQLGRSRGGVDDHAQLPPPRRRPAAGRGDGPLPARTHPSAGLRPLRRRRARTRPAASRRDDAIVDAVLRACRVAPTRSARARWAVTRLLCSTATCGCAG